MANQPTTRENPGYSTLEVHNNEPWTHMRLESQVAYDGETLPEPVPQSKSTTPQPAPPVEEIRVLGFKKRTFILLVCLVLIAVVGITVGAGVGATRNRGDGTLEDSNGSTDQESVPYDSPVLATSKLAAVNWTDSYGNHFRAVFWQARETGSLMMSLKNPSQADWEVVDIGEAAEQVPPGFRFDAQNGTNIAAVAHGAPNPDGSGFEDFRLFVAYRSSSGYLRSIACQDSSGHSWWFDDLAILRKAPAISSDSQLAAWWPTYEGQRSPNDNAFLFFQDGQQLKMIRRAWYDSGSILIGNASLQPGSGLAVAPFSQDWNLDKMMVLYAQSSTLVHAVLTAESGFGANITGALDVLTVQDGLPTPPPQVAALSFIPEGLSTPDDSLVVMRFSNGTLMMNYWNEALPGRFPDQKWSGASAPNMQGESIANFTSIALPGLDELRFFGLTPDGLIHSYTIDRQHPFDWTYEELITTTIT